MTAKHYLFLTAFGSAYMAFLITCVMGSVFHYGVIMYFKMFKKYGKNVVAEYKPGSNVIHVDGFCSWMGW